jgi:hypothetical protein
MISRQRKWQLGKISEGKCSICGREKLIKIERGKRCYQKHLIRCRLAYRRVS